MEDADIRGRENKGLEKGSDAAWFSETFHSLWTFLNLSNSFYTNLENSSEAKAYDVS